MENKKKEGLKDSQVKAISYYGTSLPSPYLNVVKSRWVRSYRKGNDYMRIIHAPSYYFAYHNYVAGVLNRKKVVIRLAVLDDDNDVVLGFSVCEGNVLHYIHVPRAYRKQGIAMMLMPNGLEWFTHLTKTGMQLWATVVPHLRFNPFL